MKRILLKSKLHCVRVTDANVEYVGSIGIDEDLMKAGNLVPYEKVLVADVNNGARLETYVIPKPAGSGEISLLGAAARLIKKDDVVIIMAFASYNEEEIKEHKPSVIFVDKNNKIKK